MQHKVYVNGEPVEVGSTRITAEELLRLTGRAGDDYKLEHRDGDGGRTTKTFEGKDVIDLDEVCGAPRGHGPGGGASTPASAGSGEGDGSPRGPGEGDGGTSVPTGAGPGEGDGSPRGPGEGSSAQTPCYFTTAYTGRINPA